MDDTDLWDLAKASTLRVSTIAAILGSEKRKPGKRESVLGHLAASLCVVHSSIRCPSSKQQNIIWGRLAKLLADLERVCTWPNNHLQSRRVNTSLSTSYPTVHALVSHSFKHSANVEKDVRLGLLAFASTHSTVVDCYLKNLDNFAISGRQGVEEAIEPSEETRRATKHLGQPDEYPTHVNQRLYATLHRHSLCSCSGIEVIEGITRRHWGRLRLNGTLQTRGNDVIFDLIFCAKPPPINPTEEIRWQQLRMQVPKRVAGSKKVQIEENASKELADTTPTTEHSELVQVGRLCKLVRSRLGDVRVCLSIQAGELKPLPDGEPTDQRIVPKPSISLAKALELYRLSTKMKFVLAYILAHSFWQFYNSDWMKSKWNSDFIHFMLERPLEHDAFADEAKISACSPCFAFNFDDKDGEFTEYCSADHIVHRYPRILALGILLIEIGRKASKAEKTTDTQSLEERINNDFSMGEAALRTKSWPDFDKFSNGALVQTYKTAVSNCFNPKIFRVHVSSDTTLPEQGVEDRRAILYQRVVLPLKMLITDMGWDDGLINMDLVGSIKSSAHHTKQDSWKPQQPTLLNATADLDHRKSEAWLHTIMASGLNKQIVKTCQQKNSRQALTPRIKIAILDTGYDEDAVFFGRDRTSRIRQWSDWVDGSSEPQDEDGHGTHVVSLAMKLAPAADIYVARVARNTDDLEYSSSNVAKAIAWAVNTCKVDIVSMSFGFHEEIHVDDEPVISNAILQAVKERRGSILFFAAAANLGGNQKEMFPANHEFVISIRGTNSEGVFQDFNPPPDRDGPAVFGTLGKDVPSAWLNTYDGEICKSGTSVATPIAAGMAGMILGYANICFDNSQLNPILGRKLWTRLGMLSMFGKMSTYMEDKCFYLSPMGFVRSSDEQRQATMILAAAKVA